MANKKPKLTPSIKQKVKAYISKNFSAKDDPIVVANAVMRAIKPPPTTPKWALDATWQYAREVQEDRTGKPGTARMEHDLYNTFFGGLSGSKRRCRCR